MGSKIVTRQANLGATLSEATSKLMYSAPCELIGLAIDYSGSANSNADITFYDGTSTAGDQILIIENANTDIGTVVPVRVFGDARLIAGTAQAGLGLGLSVFEGLFCAVTGDVTGPQSIRVFLRPLLKKSVHVVTTGAAASAAGEAVLFQGAGRFKGAKVAYKGAPATTDVTFYDGIDVANGRALTVATDIITDWVSDNRQSVTTTGISEDGAAVTAAQTGTYANDGVLFYTGLTVGAAQGDPLDNMLVVDALIEA